MPQTLPHLYDPTPILKDLQHVVYEKKDHIAYIRFNRPEVLNSFNGRMSEEMYGVWLDAKRDKDVYVAIVTGTGRAFQAGRDVKEMADHQAAGKIVPRDNPDSPYFHVEAFPNFAEFDKPVIAAIQGLVAGGGLSMMVRAHIRIMADDAFITDGHLNVGQVVSPARYIRDFGWATAMYLYLCKGRLTAQDCYRLGIVNELCPKEQVLERATAYAKMMMEIAPSILKAGTELSNMAMAEDPAFTQLAHSLRFSYQEGEGGEAGKEQARAFVEKRSIKK
jgi:enoyl-CoA hydratase/carnithine racemase